MKFSFLGYSVEKIMEFKLDVKDLAILRYFDDFRESGKMNYEVIDGDKYYWISYHNIERELPFLELSRKSIMIRMHKLRDSGLLKHYTKKEGGTFSFYAFDKKYEELTYSKNNKENSNEIKEEKLSEELSNDKVEPLNNNLNEDYLTSKVEKIVKEELAFESDDEGKIINTQDYILDRGVENKEYPLAVKKDNGYAKKGITKINLLNNSSTKESNLLKDIVKDTIDYLNLKAEVKYKFNNTRVIDLIKKRVREGFSLEDFKAVIDKKVKVWKGSKFEEYLTPLTLFGDKFEVYLNQKIIREEDKGFNQKKNWGSEPKKLRFNNFEAREYDYEALEKKLLGWD